MNEPLSQAEYEELLALGGENSQLAAELEQQRALAERLRAGYGAQDLAPMRGNSRVQVGASPFEVGANVMRNYKAGQVDQQIQAGNAQMNSNTNRQNQAVMRAILNQGQPAPGGGGMAGMGGGGPIISPYQGLKFPGGAA